MGVRGRDMAPFKGLPWYRWLGERDMMLTLLELPALVGISGRIGTCIFIDGCTGKISVGKVSR
jgi:hypothetical protein